MSKTEQGYHPVIQAIVGDVQVDAQRDLVVREERFEFWVKRCLLRHPRHLEPDLYRYLGAIAQRLSKTRTTAALQLFALATLDASTSEVARLAAGNDFLLSERADKMRRLARAIGAVGITRPVPTLGAPKAMESVKVVSGVSHMDRQTLTDSTSSAKVRQRLGVGKERRRVRCRRTSQMPLPEGMPDRRQGPRRRVRAG